MRTKLVTAAAAVAVLAVGISACTAGETSPTADATRGGTLTLASALDNNTFDPARLEIGQRVQYWMPVYDTLLVLDEESRPQPNLVTDWSYNADNTVLNLKLRDDVTFSDGTPFNGEAVKANLAHLRAGGGQNAYMAQSIEKVDVVNHFEVDLVLSAPDPGLLGYLGTVGGAMASPAMLESPDIATNPVGSGPYILDVDATVVGNKYVYARNDDYWNVDAFPYDEIVIKPIPDQTARLNALTAGQVNAAVGDPTIAAQAEQSGLTVNTTAVNWTGLVIADRDGTVVPALGDVRVRQAINFAFDTGAMLENLTQGYGELTNQVFNAQSLAFAPEVEGTYEFDLDRAHALMKDAGYPEGFTVSMPELPAFAAVNPVVEQQLAQINITVDWVKVSADAMIPELLSGKYPMFAFVLGSQSPWQDIQKLVLPTSPWNPSRAEAPELTELVTAAQFATGDEQGPAMRAISEWLVENAWFAPWYRAETLYYTDANTTVVMQSQNDVPWIRNFAPAS